MGARWLWFAVCPNGHHYSNFSGGADPCYECEEDPLVVLDCPHWGSDDSCNCQNEAAKLALGQKREDSNAHQG